MQRKVSSFSVIFYISFLVMRLITLLDGVMECAVECILEIDGGSIDNWMLGV